MTELWVLIWVSTFCGYGDCFRQYGYGYEVFISSSTAMEYYDEKLSVREKDHHWLYRVGQRYQIMPIKPNPELKWEIKETSK